MAAPGCAGRKYISALRFSRMLLRATARAHRDDSLRSGARCGYNSPTFWARAPIGPFAGVGISRNVQPRRERRKFTPTAPTIPICVTMLLQPTLLMMTATPFRQDLSWCAFENLSSGTKAACAAACCAFSLSTLEIAALLDASTFALTERKQPEVWRWAVIGSGGLILEEGCEPSREEAKRTAAEALILARAESAWRASFLAPIGRYLLLAAEKARPVCLHQIALQPNFAFGSCGGKVFMTGAGLLKTRSSSAPSLPKALPSLEKQAQLLDFWCVLWVTSIQPNMKSNILTISTFPSGE